MTTVTETESGRKCAPRIKPAFRDLIPPLERQERELLEASLEREGCRDPLITWRGYLLDGHNRLEICTRRGWEYEQATIEPDLPDESAAQEWIIRNQLGRRNLPPFVRGTLALRLKPILAAQAKERQEELGRTHGNPCDSVVTRVERTRTTLAETAGVSEGTLAKIELIEAQASDEVKAKLSRGESTVNAEAAKIRKAEKKAEAERLKAEAERLMAARVASRPAVESGQWWQLGAHRLYCGDTSQTDFIESLPKDAALAFADPPYNAGKAEWDSAFVWAHDYLADCAGIVLVTPGISSIFDFARLTAMPYRWSLAAWIDNGLCRAAVGFGIWVYIALFSRAESINRQAQDHLRVTISAADTPNSAHPSRKPAALMAQLVKTYSAEGDTVIDPFAGSGSTLFACEASGRACITGEINPEYCGEIIARWEAATGGKAALL